jgi:putative DNA primase/helicase
MNDDFESRVRDLKSRAHGHWTPLLGALGVDERILNGKNQPCPLCGGTDRFQYTDKFGEGNYHCRSCGAGGGLKLAQGALGLKFGELLARLESSWAPCAPRRRSCPAARRRRR